MKLKELLYGSVYRKTKKIVRNTEWSTIENLNNLQRIKLAETLNHAFKNVPFYSKQVRYPSIIGSHEAESCLKDLPFLSKQIIRANIKQMSTRFKSRGLIKNTGGSTGEPLIFYLDRFITRQKEKAFIFDQWSRIGYQPGDKIFNLRGAMPKKGKLIKKDFLFNVYSASSLDISAATIKSYVNIINRIKPKFLHGYPSTIYQLAILMEDGQLTLDIILKGIFCGSEKLFEYQREKIKNTFGCRVFGWYGHSEYQMLAGECEYSNKLHVYPQYGYTELFPTGINTTDGSELYEIVATGFNNPFMPLLRYKTCDYAIISKEQSCKCGRNYLLLDEVVGREQEFLVDKKENLINVTALIYGQHHKAFEYISEFQIVQSEPGEINILIKPKNNELQDKTLDFVTQIQNILEARMLVNHKIVHLIDKTKIGKKRTVQQEIDISKYLPTYK